MKKFCPNCGTELKTNADFCPNCGFNLTKKTNKVAQKEDDSSNAASNLSVNPAHTNEKHDSEKTEKVQIFCPSCGHPLKPKAEFCSNCGYNLKTKKMPEQPAASTTNNTVNAHQAPVRQHKPMTLKNKIILSVVGVLVVAFIAFYAWGSSYYSLNNQVDRITAGLTNPSQDISKYVTADNATMKVNNDTVKPLQNYYKEHQPTVTKLNSNLKQGMGNSTIQLVKNGRYWLLFPKYQLKVKTYQPQIVTNHSDSVVTVNGKNIGKLSSNSDKYYKKLSLVFPGKYHVVVKSKVAGRNLSATSTANIWGNKTLDMDIATQTFSVKSVPNGVVYINDKKVGTLDSNGETTFKSYPITRNMELYVLYNNDGKNIKSENVTDLASSFGSFEGSGYDDDNYYSDDASDESSDDVTKTDDGYIVKPKWKGVISTNDAESLLGDVFRNADDNDDEFVDGATNKDYSDLKQQQKSWDDNDNIDSWDTDVDVEAIYPAGDNSCSVVFKVTYTFDNGDSTKKQVMEFKGGIIQKDGSDQKIKTIGKGKMLSSKDESSDDDD
ncbi:hypothetical protein GCM10022297_16560 [Lactobacillus hamsteri]|uniref:Uncharacterized protein n=1 Tax=Lactobacillus hamsteri DSM 5661 = JCM 6256 TaxID=1423754 RepID=A0A0R1YE91_9LACO|nr:zinc-ribbon domain-containing protein [Lactobacillus hamsteri]KRM40824.1 hypothetical protein FC39_GL000020 [Lactobacillus hamsteri DSM 5661 = JCM 6256]